MSGQQRLANVFNKPTKWAGVVRRIICRLTATAEVHRFTVLSNTLLQHAALVSRSFFLSSNASGVQHGGIALRAPPFFASRSFSAALSYLALLFSAAHPGHA